MKKNLFPLVLSALLLFPNTVLAQTPFTDVTGHWAAAEIETIYQKGYLKGITNDTFSPNTQVTRAELAASLDRIFDFNYDNLKFVKAPTAKDFYDDIQDGQWYSDVILKCGLNGVINTENRKFSPDQPVTRLEMAKAINNSFRAKSLGVVATMMWPVYADTQNLSQEDQNAISLIFNTGIMKGKTSQQFNPNDNITRAELAVILNRTLSTLQHAFPINEEPTNGDQKVDYIEAESEKNKELEKAIIKELGLSEEEAKQTRYYYNYVDLNDDKTPEVFVQLMGLFTSGTGGDTGLVFLQKNQGFELLQKFTLIRNPIIISNEKTKGWHDIIIKISGGGVTPHYVSLKFDGEKYPNTSDGEELKNEKIEGTGLISNDIAKDFENQKGLYLSN
ncbi:S-layer homology domain-containing protein [Desulforamulus aeronauticus]|uniref:S-layer homology domain-containing protein n=1 Tax=Desulforamulus aeronauticus DSM 10349 TaxID=1121421 RepID=A0A1M6S0K0_9FIRM|nr:S-layer homology domain-containing protein [Desulforamulus aeronauticus]SHK38088.1 S-layer homology domain-containing protein [Desulforamulus aeronauticus DSM 10349]